MWTFIVVALVGLGFSFADPSVSLNMNPATLSNPHHVNLDNSVIGEPRIICGTDAITVTVATEKPFSGRLYVEGESDKPLCSQTSASTEFSVKFGDCNMRRQRTLNPRGVAYSFTIVASFHPLFVTGKDKAFHIRCFFTEAVKAVESTLDVAQLTTVQTLSRDFSLPRCNYELRHGFAGPPLRYASVGDQVTHVFQCDPLAGLVYGVLVHSCYVDDGHGNRFSLIDDRGCAVDRFLLNDLSYDNQAISAHVDSHVFKYADRVQLFFTCTVQLCFKDDGGCDGITPPQCGLHGLPSLSIPPGLHRRPLPAGLPKFLAREFPKPKSVTFPGGRTPESVVETVFPPERSSSSEEGFPSRPLSPPSLNRKPDSATGSAFGSAGYELSPFGSPFKDSPLSNANETFSDSDFPTESENATETNSEKTRQARAASKQMESDVSVALTVMPLEEELPKAPEATVNSSAKTCFSTITIVALIAGVLSAMFLSAVGTALCLARKFYRHRNASKH
uniref:ZP domain-containing protein n=1 Tax=Panagrellus redivivus TaxID=6233 RepID=A0A7E4V583_PANRE